jgi:hypothetical protein
MKGNLDPFHVVKRWWDGKPVQSDTERLGIDPSTKEGAFECLILGILYSIEDTGPDIQNTLNALRKDGLTKVDLLARIDENSGEWAKMDKIWKEYYFGGRLPAKIGQIVKNARLINSDNQLAGDIRKVYSICSGNGLQMHSWLWKLNGIKKKTFWMMREMRMRRVWDIDGMYCCVPDKQVGSSLERWYKIEKFPDYHSLKVYRECSRIVWDYFRDLYDFPVLHYAREYKCNDERRRRCSECEIVPCEARLGADGDSLMEDRETKYCIECGAAIAKRAKYCAQCGVYQL